MSICYNYYSACFCSSRSEIVLKDFRFAPIGILNCSGWAYEKDSFEPFVELYNISLEEPVPEDPDRLAAVTIIGEVTNLHFVEDEVVNTVRRDIRTYLAGDLNFFKQEDEDLYKNGKFSMQSVGILDVKGIVRECIINNFIPIKPEEYAWRV